MWVIGLSRIPFSIAASVMLCLLFVLPSASAVTVTVNIYPPTPHAHKTFVVTGQFVGYGSGVAWIMDLYDDGVCGNKIDQRQGFTSDAGGYHASFGGLPAGTYSVLVYDLFGDSSSCTPFTVKGGGQVTHVRHFTVIGFPYSICVVQVGLVQQDGSIVWIGTGVRGTPISDCQDTTEYFTHVTAGTVVLHQFIKNGTSSKMVPV